MRILGIDTTTRITSVGLVDDEHVVAERSTHAASSHGETLAPLIDRLLADAGLRVADLQAVAVSIGPGSFTGLRVGLATAKGLAFGCELALVSVPTLDALARVADAEPGELVCPILDARKGEIYAALYAADATGNVTRLTDDLALRPAELVPRVRGRCRFLGDGTDAYGEPLGQALGPVALVLPFTHYHPRGAVVAQLGRARLATAGADPAGALEPRYVRPPQIGARTSREAELGAEARNR
jgi:tRNA threonylcarbamoyladenosine biosynthesis protein TsaB